MQQQFTNSIKEAIERARIIKSKIDYRQIDSSFRPLATICCDRIDKIIENLVALIDQCNIEIIEREDIFSFQSYYSELDYIENLGVLAITRPKKGDVVLTRVVEKICDEINYPIFPPVVSSISQSYYQICTDLNLLLVPLVESDSLLHLSDIYHELCHAVIRNRNDTKTFDFTKELVKLKRDINAFFEKEIQDRIYKGGTSELLLRNLKVWKSNWIRYWAEEIFCDLFGVFAIGPAYLLSHLHLSLKFQDDLLYVPQLSDHTHPSDHARMMAQLEGLRLMGYNDEANVINDRWNKLVDILSNSELPSNDFYFAYPDIIIQQAVVRAFEGYNAIGCKIYDDNAQSVGKIINETWDEFLNRTSNVIPLLNQKLEMLKLHSGIIKA